jgi:hypothetical protein
MFYKSHKEGQKGSKLERIKSVSGGKSGGRIKVKISIKIEKFKGLVLKFPGQITETLLKMHIFG